MDLSIILALQKIAYLVVTLLLCVFLYSYIFKMFRDEKKGVRDYERYSRLALDDGLNDEIIEKRK
ncbi:cytochrome c oxidase, cbb3-type, CcoQ subunit [Helicobacter cholecystus]|uniref:Cytochrome c oxidase, cbb3-type, CcoQ subunit n=1 Tax=Helicobacter cholecystus TaxID=45498 RepID=A0A3D8IZK5_9HELI|nr:cytochrome c oxidase, cbb3-type, CcoQ subunit [Helicobacter cholecystus]RDU69981.1 cytochrome c oxidase, cbb3-type, CcoQ subunit [Helicobacter cholecystus]VEJ24850.1 cb-type cytochrome C oxidase subunit IV [Helicobacter cholecystus]